MTGESLLCIFFCLIDKEGKDGGRDYNSNGR